MADAAYSEYEPSLFKRFEQSTGGWLKITKAEAEDTLNREKEAKKKRAQKEPHK